MKETNKISFFIQASFDTSLICKGCAAISISSGVRFNGKG